MINEISIKKINDWRMENIRSGALVSKNDLPSSELNEESK